MFNLFGPTFIFQFVALVVGLTIHEFAHAATADALGDKTARMAGRVTLNPVAHLDPIGLIMILFAPIGWAKPTPVNGGNFRHPRLGSIIVTLAGPVSNLVLAIICLLAARAVPFDGFVGKLLAWGFMVNGLLFIFNLIPIPPLDGGRIVQNLLPYRWEMKYRKLELYGPFILLLIVMIPQVRAWTLDPLMQGTLRLIFAWFGPVQF